MSLSSWLRTIAGVAPLILTLIPGIPKALIPHIVNAIQQAELIPDATGPEKLKAAKTIVNDAAEVINTAKPGTINVSAINDAVTNGINTVVAVTNVKVKSASVK